MGKFVFLLFLATFTLFNQISGQIRYCNDGLGQCVGFNSCSNLTEFNDGKDHINVRFSVELETNACHYLEMCCDPEDVVNYVDGPSFVGPTSPPMRSWDLFGDESTTMREFGKAAMKKFGSDLSGDEVRLESGNHNGLLNEGEEEGGCNQPDHECVPFFYCSDDQTTDGAEFMSVRSDAPKCNSESQVCCADKDNIKKRTPGICGLHNKEGLGYSVTNAHDESQFAEFPWMAALLEIQYDGEEKYICGGSLIDKHVVLTAAHCVNNKNSESLKVRLGEWDTQTVKEIFAHSDHEVSQIIVHPDFVSSNLKSDIALLVLKNPAKLASHINTVCLPPQNTKFDNQNCLASGWGTDQYGRPDLYRVNLKKIELPTVPLRDCQDKLRTNTKLGPRFRIDTSFMCAGGEAGVDTCTGDGGSPLVCPIPGRDEIYYQAGIVAWGIECGKENVPGVYANVAKFRSWIDQQMNDLGYGTNAYTTE